MRWLALLFVLLLPALGLQMVKPVPIGEFYTKNLTKLVINPPYKHVRLKPGESTSFKVEVRNPTNRVVVLKPRVVVNPYSTYVVSPDWISISPKSTVLKPNGSVWVEVGVRVPKNAKKGFYSCDIVFTNDSIPVPYGMPRYVNALHLGLEVWIPPSVTITPKYITDFVEPGKDYVYTVELKNKANRSFSLNPQLTEPEYIGTLGSFLSKNCVEIESPRKIPPNSAVYVKIHVHIPKNATGVLRGVVKMNVNDPGLEEWAQRVTLNLNVITKPSKPFVKVIRVENVTKLTIRVTSGFSGVLMPFGLSYRGGDFDVRIVSPSGVVRVKPKVVEKSVVTMGSNVPSWVRGEGEYKVVSISKTKEYVIKYPENGVWKVEITPKGCLQFTVEVEEE